MKKHTFITLISLLLVALSFSACNSNRLYKHFVKVPNYVWEKGQKFNYKVKITEAPQKVDVILAVRVIDAFPVNDIKIKVTRISPSNKKTSDTFTMLIKDSKGKNMGEGMSDLWDIELPIAQNTTFKEKGTFEYELEQITSVDKLLGVVDVGLIIDRVE